MLQSLTIKNIALIEECTIEFGRGLNILSGETGAGKSIILDSLSFILGARSDKTLIRYGEDSASVKGIFDVSNDCDAMRRLADMGIECDGELLIYRQMSVDGKNVCRINGEKVTLSMLRSIVSPLCDICGQHDNNALLDASSHIIILDKFAGSDIEIRKENVKRLFAEYNDICASLDRLGSARDVAKKLDILGYQINEIKAAELDEDEEAELIEKARKFDNTEVILGGLNESYNVLNGDYDDNNVMSGITACIGELSRIEEFDEEIADMHSQLEDIKSQLNDISRSLSSLAESTDYDEYEARKVQDRLDAIKSLKRKYGNSVSEVLEYLAHIEEEYDFYSDSESKLEQLESKKAEIYETLASEAKELTRERHVAAEKLEKSVLTELNDLGMKGTAFSVTFRVGERGNRITSNGADDVVFMISPNIGQELKELSKIISGGEMSRFMLAVKNIIADLDGIDTLVFDEIDTGISGNIARVVAEKMCEISRARQVLAVTHLPQLAAMADAHYLISKATDGKKTVTFVTSLNRKASVEEIARLVGGNDVSKFSILHAEEMKKSADEYKTRE